jgi:hypothetical protein
MGCGIYERADGLSGAAVFANHLADIVTGYREFDPREAIARGIAGADGDAVAMIRLLRRRCCRCCRRCSHLGTLQEQLDGVRGQRALVAPMLQAIALQGDRIAARVKSAQTFDEPTPASSALIGNDNSVKRGLLRARPCEADMNGHR